MWTAQELLATFAEWTEGFTLIPGERGAFELRVNDDLVYSKQTTGRFPELSELKEALRKRLE